MIKYGLKLWTNNVSLFKKAIELYNRKKFDFIELYNDPSCAHDYKALSALEDILITIHNINNQGFHEFIIKKKQLRIWAKTVELADFFNSPYIIIHPGQNHAFESFEQNIKKINDERILIENMPGLDVFGQIMYGQRLSELKQINRVKNICFDFEKAIKAARYQDIDYKKFIRECIAELTPFYFHISGGDKNNPIDEHKNLWESNFDFKWIKNALNKVSTKKDIFLVFESLRTTNSLKNDIQNIDYFKNLKKYG